MLILDHLVGEKNFFYAHPLYEFSTVVVNNEWFKEHDINLKFCLQMTQ